MKRPKKTVLTHISHPRLHLTVVIVLLAAVLVQTVLALVGGYMVKALPSHKAAKRWSGDGRRYAVISCYLNESVGFDKRSVQNACDSVAQLLTDNGMAASNGARLWIYGYSSEASLGMRSERASLSADAILTGGDFFYFRDERLLQGSYYSEELITDDQTVLSEDAAWQLFGSADVVGMSVFVGDAEFTVTGVVAEQKDSDKPRVYLPLSAYERIYGSTGITCLEFLLPDPVGGFALSLVERSVTAEEKHLAVTDHRARFEMGTLYNYLGDFTSVLVPEKQIFYPEWEQNEKRLEFAIAMMLIGRTACFAAIAVCVMIELAVLYKVKDAAFEAVKTFAVDRKDRVQEASWARQKKRKAARAQRESAVTAAQVSGERLDEGSSEAFREVPPEASDETPAQARDEALRGGRRKGRKPKRVPKASGVSREKKPKTVQPSLFGEESEEAISEGASPFEGEAGALPAVGETDGCEADMSLEQPSEELQNIP